MDFCKSAPSLACSKVPYTGGLIPYNVFADLCGSAYVEKYCLILSQKSPSSIPTSSTILPNAIAPSVSADRVSVGATGIQSAGAISAPSIKFSDGSVQTKAPFSKLYCWQPGGTSAAAYAWSYAYCSSNYQATGGGCSSSGNVIASYMVSNG
ncbi:hypothetical protein HY498_00050 [Candidatus Woesearchaeota archaeon]|nr:hypothetical protein [Candidatus Woesearchaeota archaeon]